MRASTPTITTPTLSPIPTHSTSTSTHTCHQPPFNINATAVHGVTPPPQQWLQLQLPIPMEDDDEDGRRHRGESATTAANADGPSWAIRRTDNNTTAANTDGG